MNNDNLEIQEQQILDFLSPRCEIKASYNLRKNVTTVLYPPKKSKFLKWAVGGICSVAAAVTMIILAVSHQMSAKDVISDALDFIGDSFTIEFEARTLPSENFAYLDKDLPFSLITLSVSGKEWRIDKRGRIAMGNDSVRYMWLPEYRTGWLTHKPNPNFIDDFNRVLNPRQLLTYELSIPDNEKKMIIDGNSIVIHSNMDNLTYRYVFDKNNHRFLSYTITDGNKLLLRTTGIYYTQPKKLRNAVPDNINWIDVSEMKGSFKGLSAKETAQIALTALRNWQADIVSQGFTYCAYDVNRFKELYSGAILLNISAPLQGATPYKFFVPYRLRLKNGTIQSGSLSLERQVDGSWIIDGGI